MAKRKSPDKFRVGQAVVMVLDASSGWHQFDGTFGTVLEGKRLVDVECADFGGGRCNLKRNQWRYLVRFAGFELYVRESQMRPLRDDGALSTWERFAQATGIRLVERIEVKAPAPREPHHG